MIRLAWITLILCLNVWASPDSRSFDAGEQELIRTRLLEAGLDSAHVKTLPLDSLHCYPGAWRINLHGRDLPDYYRSFQTKEVVDKVRSFIKGNESLLVDVERRHRVSRYVVASILMIESRLGRNWGDYRVPDLFLSLLLLPEHAQGLNLDSALVREAREGRERQRDELEELLDKRAAKRSRWAAREFCALHDLFPQGEWSGLEGSWAGAMGLPQFLPSSLAAYGDDGDGDGRVDLYQLPDAAMSIGRYLKENGWRGKLTEKKRRKAIKAYNHSENYVNAVLRLARDAGMPAP
jgi:membrane-bound lytic murein transglycosylase B